MKRMIAAALAAVAFAATFFAAPSLALAEVGDVSTVQLDVEPDGVDATLDLPLVAVEAALGTSATDLVASYLADHVHIAYASDGKAWASSSPLLTFEQPSDAAPTVSARMHFTRPDELHENALELTDDAIVETRAAPPGGGLRPPRLRDGQARRRAGAGRDAPLLAQGR